MLGQHYCTGYMTCCPINLRNLAARLEGESCGPCLLLSSAPGHRLALTPTSCSDCCQITAGIFSCCPHIVDIEEATIWHLAWHQSLVLLCRYVSMDDPEHAYLLNFTVNGRSALHINYAQATRRRQGIESPDCRRHALAGSDRVIGVLSGHCRVVYTYPFYITATMPLSEASAHCIHLQHSEIRVLGSLES